MYCKQITSLTCKSVQYILNLKHVQLSCKQQGLRRLMYWTDISQKKSFCWRWDSNPRNLPPRSISVVATLLFCLGLFLAPLVEPFQVASTLLCNILFFSLQIHYLFMSFIFNPQMDQHLFQVWINYWGLCLKVMAKKLPSCSKNIALKLQLHLKLIVLCFVI